MSINSVSSSYSNVVNNTTTTKKATDKKTNENTSTASKADSYEKSTASTTKKPYDAAKVQQLLKQTQEQTAKFEQMIVDVLAKQTNKTFQAMPNSNLKAFFSGLEVDAATQAQAQKDIADDGYWGVDQTAGRILDFAKAIAGDDPEQLEKMRTAVQKGFKEAERMWGGKLPDISGRTYDTVMKGFDDWSSSINNKASEEI